jgi:hypothetical protein
MIKMQTANMMFLKWSPRVALSISLCIISLSCKELDPEADLIIASDHVEHFEPGEYRFHGYLINIGDNEVINHGFLWDIESIPNIGSHVIELGGTDTEKRYTGDIFLIGGNITYAMRAFASTANETKLGSPIEFAVGEAPRLPFEQITLEHILTVPVSEALIDGSNNAGNQIPPGTIILYKTNEERFGKLQILDYGYNLGFRWNTFAGDGSVYSAGDYLEIRGTFSADLDAGIQSAHDDPANVPDFWWNQLTDEIRYFQPVNGGLFHKYYTE